MSIKPVLAQNSGETICDQSYEQFIRSRIYINPDNKIFQNILLTIQNKVKIMLYFMAMMKGSKGSFSDQFKEWLIDQDGNIKFEGNQTILFEVNHQSISFLKDKFDSEMKIIENANLSANSLPNSIFQARSKIQFTAEELIFLNEHEDVFENPLRVHYKDSHPNSINNLIPRVIKACNSTYNVKIEVEGSQPESILNCYRDEYFECMNKKEEINLENTCSFEQYFGISSNDPRMQDFKVLEEPIEIASVYKSQTEPNNRFLKVNSKDSTIKLPSNLKSFQQGDQCIDSIVIHNTAGDYNDNYINYLHGFHGKDKQQNAIIYHYLVTSDHYQKVAKELIPYYLARPLQYQGNHTKGSDLKYLAKSNNFEEFSKNLWNQILKEPNPENSSSWSRRTSSAPDDSINNPYNANLKKYYQRLTTKGTCANAQYANQTSYSIAIMANYNRDEVLESDYLKIAELICNIKLSNNNIKFVYTHRFVNTINKYLDKTCPGVNFNMSSLNNMMKKTVCRGDLDMMFLDLPFE